MYEKSQVQGKETVSNVLGQFMDTTSAHGFFSSEATENIFHKKYSGYVFLLIAFGGLGYHLSFLIIKYLDYGHEETTENGGWKSSFSRCHNLQYRCYICR